MALIDLIFDMNPWWRDRQAIQQDKYIQAFEASKIKWRPPLLKLPQKEDALHIIKGPRQAGKTTLLKLLIKNLLADKNVSEKDILFLSIDAARSVDEVLEVILYFFKTARTSNRKYLFLDEASFLPEWPRGIKVLIDMGFDRNATYVVTGSSAIDLKKSSEKLPGRRGKGSDFVLLPLSFGQFLSVLYPQIRLSPVDSISQFFQKKEEDFLDLLMYKTELDGALHAYLQTGGFPSRIDAHLKGELEENPFMTFRAIIEGDLARLNRNASFLMHMALPLLKHLGTPVDWKKLAVETGMGSHHTAQDYISILSDSYILYFLQALDANKNVPRLKKGKRIYPFDPVISRLLMTYHPHLAIEDPALVEAVVGSHVLRKSRFINSGLSSTSDLFYWQSKAGKEIDFVFLAPEGPQPVEVKYQNRVTLRDSVTMIRHFDRGLLLSKKDFEVGSNVLMLPVSWFLAMI
ncbi:MAG: ATP-binding protein [Desulfobacterales bacterium]|nr:ATP-binding protein [Desulfobacterales bacterium]